jgi:hypothetical protein
MVENSTRKDVGRFRDKVAYLILELLSKQRRAKYKLEDRGRRDTERAFSQAIE